MKTQFSFRKYGFTLIEIAIVISILGVLFYQFSKISFRPQEDLAKAERLANRISSILHEWLINVTIGRMDVTQSATTQATIGVSTTTGIIWRYTSALSGSFIPPFYDGDAKYEIRDITWTGWRASAWAISGTSAYITVIANANSVSFSGIANTTATTVTFRTRYLNMNKKVIFDRRTGRIEVNKD